MQTQHARSIPLFHLLEHGVCSSIKTKKIKSIWPEDTQAGKSSSYVRENLEICTFNTFIIQETLLKSQEENEWLRKLT